MSCSTCLSRREFVAQTTLAAVAAALAACGGSDPAGPGGGSTPPPLTGPLTVVIANHPELAQDLRPVAVNASVAVVRTGPGQFLAFSRACTHEGTTVNVNAGGFLCPNHGSAFRADGSVLNGPATTPLRRLGVTLNAAGTELTITP